MVTCNLSCTSPRFRPRTLSNPGCNDTQLPTSTCRCSEGQAGMERTFVGDMVFEDVCFVGDLHIASHVSWLVTVTSACMHTRNRQQPAAGGRFASGTANVGILNINISSCYVRTRPSSQRHAHMLLFSAADVASGNHRMPPGGRSKEAEQGIGRMRKTHGNNKP